MEQHVVYRGESLMSVSERMATTLTPDVGQSVAHLLRHSVVLLVHRAVHPQELLAAAQAPPAVETRVRLYPSRARVLKHKLF